MTLIGMNQPPRNARTSLHKTTRRNAPGLSKIVDSLVQSPPAMILVFGVLLCLSIALWTGPQHTSSAERGFVVPLFSTTKRRHQKLHNHASNVSRAAPAVRFEVVQGSRKVTLPPRQEKRLFMQPDYNNLQIHHLNDGQEKRDVLDQSIGPGPFIKDVVNDYWNDDDFYSNPYINWDNGAALAETYECRLPELADMHYPTCNPIHELGFISTVQSGRAKVVGKGTYRQVFAIDGGYPHERFVFKEAVFEDDEEDWTQKDFEHYVMDGIVSAAITPHPLFVDFYSFCGLSMLAEIMENGDMDEKSGVKKHRCDPKPLYMGPNRPLVSLSKLNVTEKLQLSLDMAEAFAMMHNHPLGVMVHDDVQPSQFLLKSDGRIKLNDFNRAEVMHFDEENQEYCKYKNGGGAGDWRAPEEYENEPLDESIDVFSLGNNMYALLTGTYIFPGLCENTMVQEVVQHGKRSFLDQRFEKQSYGEGELLWVINQTWAEIPEKRPSMGEVVVMLRHILEEHLELEKQEEEESDSRELG